MIILGDDLVPFEEICLINKISDIKNSKANSTLIFAYDKDLLSYCSKNSLSFGVIVNSILESIYSNALNAKYIICTKDIDKKIEEIAENYMFDSKVLTIIEDSKEIEEVAIKQIDGVINKKLLGKL